MRCFLHLHRSPRFGHDGWALLMDGASKPLEWTVSTTREEVRALRREREDMFASGTRVVKVRIGVETVE